MSGIHERSQGGIRDLTRDGYLLLPAVYEAGWLQCFTERLTNSLETDAQETVLRSRGRAYGSRGLLETFPATLELLEVELVKRFLREVLGAEAGLVRVLYFDKPPERSWSVPWHRDLTIAVRDNQLPTQSFRCPTTKAGVPHVEAPQELLSRMLTLRVHLDPMVEENGPLRVIPGSHLSAVDETTANPVTLHAQPGDILAMRPLLLHCSGMSHPTTRRHRRVVHFEFAADPQLPDGYAWHQFMPMQ